MSNITERTVPCIDSPGNDPDSKFKVQFLLEAYHFHTVVKLTVSGTILSQGLSIFKTILKHRLCLYPSLLLLVY